MTNTSRKLRPLFASLLLVSWAWAASAQGPSSATAEKPDYTKEATVVELLSSKVSFENDGTSVQEVTVRARIQSDAGVQRYGLLTFTYQGATQTVEFEYVRVRKPSGSVVETPPDNIQDLDAGITREAPFYSDLREKHVAVKGLSAGDTLEYQVRWRATKSLAPGQFWHQYSFEREAIILDQQLQVSVPQGRTVKVKSPGRDPVVAEEGNRRTYTWKVSNLQDHSKENAAGKDLDAKLGREPPPDVQISSFQSWEEVGEWYGELQKERIQPTAEIRAKAAELTKGASDPSAALHRVYDFVSTKFRYIGVAFGIGRYQPHAADDVLSNQYGDCKDKHTLLASLLQAAGITAYPALISTSHALDPDVPSPAQFDHVISAVPQGNGFQWLDTTAEVGPFGYLMPQLREKQALVIPGDKPARLVRTPPDLPFAGIQKFSVEGKLSEQGTLDSKMEYSARGDLEVIFRSAFRQVAQPQWKDLAQQISYRLGFAGTVSDVTASSPENTEAPFHFSYSYNRKDYPDWSTHQINMPGLPFSLPDVQEDEAHSKDPIWLGPSLQMISDAKVDLPTGYSPELPESVVLVKDFAEYRATYSQEQGAVVSHRELRVKKGQVPDAARGDYKEFLKGLRDDVNRFIPLTSYAAPAAPAAPAPPMEQVGASLLLAIQSLPRSENPKAQQFETDAFQDMRGDPAQAISALRQAVAADPKFTRDWIILGSIYLGMARKEEAIDAFHKAIESDPKESVPYRTLAYALISLHREADAIQVWQDLLKAVPEDRDGVTNLGKLLYDQKRYAEAVPVLQTDVRLNPSAAAPLSRLSLAYLKSGDLDKGYAALQQMLKLDSSPLVLNDAAFALAEANTRLDEALDFAQRAVRAQEEASGKIRLANLADEDLYATLRIGSFWDTLGWVHFRLGRLDAAEKYFRASWMLLQKPIAGDHLGQLYEQRLRPQEAIHMYRLALRASSTIHDSTDQGEIQAHLQRLVPSASFSTGMDLHRLDATGDELSQMRSVKLRRIIPDSASAEFFLLFGPGGKLEDVKFISGSDKLKAADKFIREGTFPVLFPDDSAAHLLRRAIVSCSSISGCSLVLYTPDTVTSVNGRSF